MTRDIARAVNLWPIAALIIGIVVAVIGLTVRAALLADARQEQETAEHVGPVLDTLSQSIGVAVVDYAWWDEAFQALHVNSSSEWARENLSTGSVIGHDRSIDGVLVVGSDGQVLHALWRGAPLAAAEVAKFKGGLAVLVRQARERLQGKPEPVSASLAYGDEVALAAAAAVFPANGDPTEVLGRPASVLVFMRTLTPDFTNRVGALYGLPMLSLSASPTSSDRSVHPLTGADGKTQGYLEWQPARPGTKLFQAIWLEALLVIVLLTTVGLFVVHQFLTQRRTLLAQVKTIEEGVALLNDSLAKLSNALRAVDYGIAMYDRAGKLTHWNISYEKLWLLPPGMARQGIGAREILDYCIKQMGFETAASDEFGNPSTDPYALEPTGRWVYWRADGTRLSVHRMPLPDGGYLSVSCDTTQQAKHEKELVAAKEQAVLANRSKSEFLANVSHELRTPLNAIIGFSEILSRELFGPLGNDRYKTYAVDIHNSGEHLLSLINDILDLSKIESGRFKLRLEVFDCVELSQSVARLIRPRAQENGLELTIEVPKVPVALNADKRALKQVLINLLANAVKFTPENGKIVLSCAAVNGGVEFAVADTGIGIDEKDIETALAPFGQIDSQYSRRHEGTGLGLTIVNGIVSLHKGTLKVASRVGEGTKVTIFVPDQGIVGDGGADRPRRDFPHKRWAAS